MCFCSGDMGVHTMSQEARAAEQDRSVDQQGNGGRGPGHATDRGRSPADSVRQAAQVRASALSRREGEPATTAAVGLDAEAAVQPARRGPAASVLSRRAGQSDANAPTVPQRFTQLRAILVRRLGQPDRPQETQAWGFRQATGGHGGRQRGVALPSTTTATSTLLLQQ